MELPGVLREIVIIGEGFIELVPRVRRVQPIGLLEEAPDCEALARVVRSPRRLVPTLA